LYFLFTHDAPGLETSFGVRRNPDPRTLVARSDLKGIEGDKTGTLATIEECTDMELPELSWMGETDLEPG